MLVNNAAVRAETPFADMPLDEWRRVLATILDGCVPLRAGLPAAPGARGRRRDRQHRRHDRAHRAPPGRAHVVTAKAGLAGMTRALALELAPQAITVNCVVPGTIDTVRGLPGAPERPAHRQGLPPLGRRGEPDEVAAAVRFLCGPGARYITGQSLHVNGGGYMAMKQHALRKRWPERAMRFLLKDIPAISARERCRDLLVDVAACASPRATAITFLH